jgi:cytochrome P450
MTPAVPRLPGGRWLLGQLPRLRREPLVMLLEAASVGPVVRLANGPLRIFLVREPRDIKRVLLDNHKNYDKQTVSYWRARPLVGDGLLTSDGAHWLRQRRLAQPAFHKRRVDAFAGAMVQAASAMADSWRPAVASGQPIDVARELTAATMSIAAGTLLGGDVSGDAAAIGEAFNTLSAQILERTNQFFPAPLWLPTASHRRFRAALATLESIVYRIIAARRADPAAQSRHDLLSLLMEARDEATGEGMSDAQLRDEVMTIFLAGHETTAVALTWTFYLLSQHPEAERRLRDEVQEVLGDRPAALADLERLPWTRMVIDEAMRLYPPVWALTRRARAADELGGFAIPRGSMVFISPWVTHRQAHLWDRPNDFDPTRFAAARPEASHGFAYFPFLGGPRQCIGAGFASLEARLILATVAQRYRLALVPGHPVEPQALMTLRSRHGMQMTVRSAAT